MYKVLARIDPDRARVEYVQDGTPVTHLVCGELRSRRIAGVANPTAVLLGDLVVVTFELPPQEFDGFSGATRRALDVIEMAWGAITGLRPIVEALEVSRR